MKVLFMTPWYPSPEHRYRGVFVREHARAARAAGNDVVVLDLRGRMTGGRGLWRLQEETDQSLTDGIRTYHVARRTPRVPLAGALLLMWSAIRAPFVLRSRGFRPDVIHANVYYATIPAVIAGRLMGVPVVATEHSTLFPLRKIVRPAVWLSRLAFRRAARVMPVCQFLQTALEAYGIEARYSIVPNAVDPTLFHPSSDRTVHESAAGDPTGGGSVEIGRAERRLIFVGNLEPTEHKGFPTLLAALALLEVDRQDWRLDVIGDGPSRRDYEARVATEPFSARVTFHGSMPKLRIAEMMRRADAFVMPSRFENLPCVIIEAMASGLPVVSTNVGGIPEMVTAADGELVDPRDPQALAGAIDRVLSNPGAFDPTAIARRAVDRFGLEAVGAAFQSIYEQSVSAAAVRREAASS